DDAPVDRVVHVVEEVDVADAHRVFADLGGVLAAPGLQVRLPPQPALAGGALQTLDEVVGDARWPLGLAVDVDPERLGLHHPATALPINPHPHLTPPVRCARTPPAQPQHVLELDRLDQIDHRAPDNPQRVGLFEAQLAQMVLADVLDVPGRGVEPQPALTIDV